jgi:hypothetical protein
MDVFSFRMDPQTRGQLNCIAEQLERKPGDVVRLLIRREAHKFSPKNKTALASPPTKVAEADATADA